VLARRDGLRVTLSWGARRGALLGTIAGSALTVLRFTADGDRTRQRLDTYVVIDNRVAATLARALVALFGHIADQKLARGFEATAKVAAWVSEHPDEFCAWVAASAELPRRSPRPATLPSCPGVDHPASVAR
jgi:hypothetical protein